VNDRPTSLELHGLTKAYPGTTAVDDLSLPLVGGQIHALVGANGAGKSTLVQMLSGAVGRTSGQIILNGRELNPKSPHDAQAAGIVSIHQDLAVAPDLTVAENIVLGHEPRLGRLPGTVSRQAAGAVAVRVLRRLGARLSPNARVAGLRYPERQLVAIARALAVDYEVLILDEPTAALTQDAAEQLHSILRDLRRDGRAILYISHRLDEIRALAQRVSIMRDGRLVATVDPSATHTNEIIRLMVGEAPVLDAERAGRRVPTVAADVTPAIEVLGLTREPHFRNVSFAIRPGEVVGVAGIPGSGREALVRALVGSEPVGHGEILIGGRVISLRSPRHALKEGVLLLPGDRAESGLAVNQTVRTNLLLPPGGDTAPHGFRRHQRELDRAAALIRRVGCRPADPERPVRMLSGGNQQRVLFARALYAKPHVLVLDEPTQGVDVKGKAEIHALVREFATSKTAVVLSSSDFEELEATCDRILVMRLAEVAGWVEPEQYGGQLLLGLALPA
jgi:ABC-type sugar transport system ATPase subunit